MSNFDITELLTDGWTDGPTNRPADGRMDRQTEKRAPMLQSQEVRKMFHAKFDGCLVL